MRTLAQILVCIWSLLLNSVAFALKPTSSDVADISSPVFTVYGTEDGLSDEVWSTVGIDRDGFVWAGSASQLARFDSQRWTLWSFPEAKSLVRDMEPDAQGNLWAIFEGEGLARYDGKRWQLLGSDVQLHRFSQVRSPQKLGDQDLAAQKPGTDPTPVQQLWVTTEGKGLSMLGPDGRWQRDPANGVLPGDTVTGIERTQQLFGAPREWLATNTGLWSRAVPAQQMAPTPWQRYLAAPESQQIAGTDLLVTIENGVETLWMTSYGGGVLRIREEGVKVWRAATGELPSEAIYSAVVTYDRNGAALIWLSSRGGLIRISGDTATTYDRRHGLPSDAVRGVKVQRVGEVDVLWIATEHGVARTALTYSRWQSVSLHGARENGIFGLLVETDAGATRVWAGSSSQGLAVLANGRWRQLLEADGYDIRRVRMLAGLRGPGGSYWRLLSLLDGPLLRISDDGTFRAVATPWPMPPGQTVTGMYAQTERAAGMWFATARSGVFRLRQGSWQAIPLRGSELSDPDSWIVYRFVETPKADGTMQLWALGNTGLARLDGEYFQSVAKQIDLKDGVRGGARIQLNQATRLWLGSNRRGVIQLDVSDPQHPKVVNDGLPALADPTIYSVLQDTAKRIYLCTNNGVQLLTPKAGGGFDSEIFRRRDGLIHDECNTNGQLIDAQDRYWVGTLGGLGRFDPQSAQSVVQRQRRASSARPLRLSAVDIDGRTLPWPLPETLEIPAGTRDLQLSFSLLSGVREGESRYRSQLLAEHSSALDADASPWSSDPTRHLGNLAPGRYQLWVEARDYAGIQSAPLSISLNINAHWWQMPVVQIISALITLGLIGLGVWLYNRQLRLRQSALSQLVQEKTVELSQSNRQLLALSYTDPLTNIANRRRLTEAMQLALSRAQQRQLPMAVILVDIDFFKQYNDQHGHLAGDAALRAVAQTLNSAVREQDLVARYGGEEFACLLIDTSREFALQVAERMRTLVAELPARALGNDRDTITLSAGVLCQIPAQDDTPERLISGADAALYQAKAQGRNRVVFAAES